MGGMPPNMQVLTGLHRYDTQHVKRCSRSYAGRRPDTQQYSIVPTFSAGIRQRKLHPAQSVLFKAVIDKATSNMQQLRVFGAFWDNFFFFWCLLFSRVNETRVIRLDAPLRHTNQTGISNGWCPSAYVNALHAESTYLSE